MNGRIHPPFENHPESEGTFPTIKALETLGGSGAIQEINEKAIELKGYTDDQLAVMHGHGEKSEIEYRLAWARTRWRDITRTCGSAT